MLPYAGERPAGEGGSVVAYLLAALGGALGALARWAVAEGLPRDAGAWPWATLVVNLTGCLLIGVLLAVLSDRFASAVRLRPFLATGVLGGYTTYSTFAMDAVALVEAGRPALAVTYVAASVLGGLVAVVGGLVAGRGLVGPA